MKTQDDIEKLEKTIGQLNAIHREISLLSKKSPNDAINHFKLKTINAIIAAANDVLGNSYRPVKGFEQFEEDDLPTTSDVVFVIAQYMEEISRFRKDNTFRDDTAYVYILNGEPSGISTDPMSRERI